MEATVEISNLHKRFGATVALGWMTFTVAPGEATRFVGPNGPGKSTSMLVIPGLDAPDAGSALIGGQRYQTLRHTAAQVAFSPRLATVPS
jgi:ABC-2 type transport system ATP-binding protein